MTDLEITAKSLHSLLNLIWTHETFSNSWKESQIVKILKKGDIKNCSNWRGISLLSILSKTFITILMLRMKSDIEKD